MYESQIVEVEDYNFCHYINHFDEFEETYPTYDEIFELDEVLVEEENEEVEF